MPSSSGSTIRVGEGSKKSNQIKTSIRKGGSQRPAGGRRSGCKSCGR